MNSIIPECLKNKCSDTVRVGESNRVKNTTLLQELNLLNSLTKKQYTLHFQNNGVALGEEGKAGFGGEHLTGFMSNPMMYDFLCVLSNFLSNDKSRS